MIHEVAPNEALVAPETEPWWEATRQRRLVVQRCLTCEQLQHYPRVLCLACDGTELDFVEVSGWGTVYSFTTVHRSPDPARFPPPYTIALVRLDEGPVMFTRLVDVPDPRCDQRVRVEWWPLKDGRHLPVFTAEADSSPPAHRS